MTVTAAAKPEFKRWGAKAGANLIEKGRYGERK